MSFSFQVHLLSSAPIPLRRWEHELAMKNLHQSHKDTNHKHDNTNKSQHRKLCNGNFEATSWHIRLKSLAWSSEKKPVDINARFLFLGVVLTKIIRLSVVLYGFKTVSLTSREELVFRVSDFKISQRLPASLPSSEVQAGFHRNFLPPSSRTFIETGIKFHRNVGIFVPMYTASCHRNIHENRVIDDSTEGQIETMVEQMT
jgi:hypothetical protein